MFDLFGLPQDIQEGIILKCIDDIDNEIYMIEYKLNFFQDHIEIFSKMKDIFKNNVSQAQLADKVMSYEENLDYVAYIYEITSDDYIGNIIKDMEVMSILYDCIETFG